MFDTTQTEEARLLNPWRDSGLWLIGAPGFIWRPMAHTVIESFAASALDEVNDRIDRQIAKVHADHRFLRAVEYNSMPVLLNNAHVSAFGITVGGQPLFGTDPAQDVTALAEHAAACRSSNAGWEIPVLEESITPVLDFALSCRTLDPGDFITETLARLCVLDGMDFAGRILIHCAQENTSRQSAAGATIDALFPEFAGRVEFIDTPGDYEFVLTAYDLVEAHFIRPWQADPFAELATGAKVWRGLEYTPEAEAMLQHNTVSKGHLSLRARALAAAEGRDASHLPRRFYITKSEADGPWEGEDGLLDYLGRLGFEPVDVGVLDPLDRVALMANAEMVVSFRGSALDDMLFAKAGAFLIDLDPDDATGQSRAHWPVANAAQCSYLRFVLGAGADDPVTLGDRAVARIVSLIVTLLGQYPDLTRAASLKNLAQDVLRVGAYERVAGLLAQHGDLVAGDADLCLIKADCCRQLRTPRAELAALDQAFKADPSRFQTLLRIIWCARDCDRPQVIRWALSRLKRDFPDRHDSFFRTYDWIRGLD